MGDVQHSLKSIAEHLDGKGYISSRCLPTGPSPVKARTLCSLRIPGTSGRSPSGADGDHRRSRVGEELTATECAALTGLSPSATAYHLRSLERYDFAERLPPAATDVTGRGGRPVDGGGSISTLRPRPGGRSDRLSLAFIDRSRAVAEQFIATEGEEPEEWRDVAALMNADVWLNVEETKAVASALAAVVEPYRTESPATGPTARDACGSRTWCSLTESADRPARRGLMHRFDKIVRHAGVAQLVEHQLPKLRVASSSLVARFSGFKRKPPWLCGFSRF